MRSLREGTEPRRNARDSQRRGTSSAPGKEAKDATGCSLPFGGIALFCLGILLSLLATTVSEAPFAVAGADVGHADGEALAPLAEYGSLPLTPAEEARETDERPVNASLLRMLLALVYFGACVGWLLMTNARRHGVMSCSPVDDRSWLAVTPEGPSLLEVFRL
jgi:hypothetical protein